MTNTEPCESGCPDTRMHLEECSEHHLNSCVVCLLAEVQRLREALEICAEPMVRGGSAHRRRIASRALAGEEGK